MIWKNPEEKMMIFAKPLDLLSELAQMKYLLRSDLARIIDLCFLGGLVHGSEIDLNGPKKQQS